MEVDAELGNYDDRLTAQLMCEAYLKGDRLITVCDSCYQASCWQYIFLCDFYDCAGVVAMTPELLRRRGSQEDESYWKTDEELAE